jgi:hypothetical protein
MNKEYLQQMFGQYKGYVYRYAGDIIPDVDILHYITDQYADLTHNNIVSTVVPTAEGYLFYVDQPLETESEKFTFICDLVPEYVEVPFIPPQIDGNVDTLGDSV